MFSSGNEATLHHYVGGYTQYANIGFPHLLTTTYQSGLLRGLVEGKKSADEKTVSWYQTTGQNDHQLNASGTTYHYIAIG